MRSRLALAVLVAGGILPAAVAALASGSREEAAGRGSGATWADVAPIFASKCASCHSSTGIAPFPLTDPHAAAARAKTILAVTRAGVMPPWMPGRDSPRYLGQSARILTPAEKALIARWARSGAPTAGATALIAPRGRARGAGSTITLAPARAYLPKAGVGGLDDYHCFLLEPRTTRDEFVTGAVVEPGRPAIVHHAILFEAAGQDAAEARRLDRRSGGRGWTCFGGPGLSETGGGGGSADRLGAPQWISAWVPGHTRNETPRGTGVLLHAGAAIVMQVHYNLIHGAKPDRSRTVLHVVPAAGAHLKALDTMLVPAPVELPCPSGVHSRLCRRDVALAQEAQKYGRDAAFIPFGLLYLCRKTLADYAQAGRNPASIATSCDRGITRPVRIYGVAGHMHLRGTQIRVELDPGTPRARTLLDIPRWDFHWQDAYYLAHPVDAGPGDTIRVTCRFDNTAENQPVVKGGQLAPRYVLWGEGTTDEMCLGLLQIAER